MEWKFKIGQHVKHRDWGEGIVVALDHRSNDVAYRCHYPGESPAYRKYWLESNLTAVEPPAPFTTNTLGDFPKKEAR